MCVLDPSHTTVILTLMLNKQLVDHPLSLSLSYIQMPASAQGYTTASAISLQ